MGAEKRSRAEGASLLPQAVGGSAKRLEPTRVTFVFLLGVSRKPPPAPRNPRHAKVPKGNTS